MIDPLERSEMIENLIRFLEKLKTKPTKSTDEASIKQGIVLPVLDRLKWDIADTDEVKPEYTVENRRVDYSLRINNIDKVFIEAKNADEDLSNDRHQEQLLDYSFRRGIKISILTNGMTWWFYLPMKEGEWKARKFYTIDIDEQEISAIAEKFVDLLSKHNIKDNKALDYAEEIGIKKRIKEVLEEKLPEAWNKILAEPDPLLIDLISKSTEKLCGITPEIEDVKRILKRVEKNAVLPAQSVEPINKEPKSQRDINAGEQGSSERYPEKKRGYVKSYRNQLKNPNSLTSKIKRFIDEKGSVSSNELKRVCVERFGCKSDTSGSIGAGIRVLLIDGHITEDGRADNRRFFSKKR
jgi:hypothetical protein